MSALGPILLRSPQTYSTRLYLRQERNIWRFQARPPQNSQCFSSITWTLEKSWWHHQHYPPWWYSHCWCWLEDSPKHRYFGWAVRLSSCDSCAMFQNHPLSAAWTWLSRLKTMAPKKDDIGNAAKTQTNHRWIEVGLVFVVLWPCSMMFHYRDICPLWYLDPLRKFMKILPSLYFLRILPVQQGVLAPRRMTEPRTCSNTGRKRLGQCPPSDPSCAMMGHGWPWHAIRGLITEFTVIDVIGISWSNLFYNWKVTQLHKPTKLIRSDL